ncbi:Exonuclease-like protein 2 [Elsinoe fawcettii]|nr:Exonuclease-like protein 2 [Elsinoe fawcettii]
MKRKRGERDSGQGFDPVSATLDLVNHANGPDNATGDEHKGKSTSRRSSTSSEPKTKLESGSKREEQGWEIQEDRATRKKRKKVEKNYPALLHSHHARLQSFVKLSDLQNLVLYLLADGTSPQWISVQNHQHIDKVVVLMVPGLDAQLLNGAIELNGKDVPSPVPDAREDFAKVGGDGDTNGHKSTSPKTQKMNIRPDDYYPSKLAQQKLPKPLKPLSDLFTHVWPIKTPGDPRRMHSPMYGILSSPIPRPKEDNKIKGAKPPAEARGWKNQRTPITEYIMTKGELLENGFAVHPAHFASESEREIEKARRHKAVQSPTDGWVDLLPTLTSPLDGSAADSDIEDGSILQGRRLLLMDCEMVSTITDRFALARISLIDWDGTVVLDELIKPPDPIKDYLTPYSGITKEMMDGATLTLADIQRKLEEIVTPQTILAGHSLDSDFRALKISYPFVVDTTLLYPHPKGPPQKSSLKWLTQKYLSREIQGNSIKGHDSVEDAKAVLDLVRQKCEKGKSWGTGEANGEPIFKRLARAGKLKGDKGKKQGEEDDWECNPRKTGAMVDWLGNMHGFGASAKLAISCGSDEEVVRGLLKAAGQDVNGETDGQEADGMERTGGCDFIFGRLRELEFERGWSPRIPGLAPATAKLDDDDLQIDLPLTGDDNPSNQSFLEKATTQTVKHIEEIYKSLPERTAVIIFSGSGDPRKMIELQKLHAQFKEEYATKKWDELSVKWTDDEEQALKRAVEDARKGIGFIGVTPMKSKS